MGSGFRWTRGWNGVYGKARGLTGSDYLKYGKSFRMWCGSNERFPDRMRYSLMLLFKKRSLVQIDYMFSFLERENCVDYAWKAIQGLMQIG